MYIVGLDVSLAMFCVLIGLGYGSAGLTAAAVLSVADMFSLGRPRKAGLGDDYASLAVAIFVAWAGISQILGGIRDSAVEASVHPMALVATLVVIAVKLVLLQSRWINSQAWVQAHQRNDASVLGLVAITYLVTFLFKVHLEPGLVIVIGALVLYQSIELISEAIQEIRAEFKR